MAKNVAGLYILVAQCDMFLFIRSPLRVLGPHSSPRDISKSSSAELITTTTVNIAMKLKEFPQVMEFVSYEHTPFSTAGNGSCLPNFGHGTCYYLLSSHLRNELYSLFEYTY